MLPARRPCCSRARPPARCRRSGCGSNVYATQFHPELDVEGLCLRIDIYRHHGYFDPPEEAEELMRMARAAVVTEPPRLLARFVELYAR